MAAKSVNLDDPGEPDVRPVMIPWDEPDVDSGYPSHVIPGVINPVMFNHPTVPDHMLTVSEAGDNPQPLRQPKRDPEKPVEHRVKAGDHHDLRPDPTMVDMEVFRDDPGAEAQATIKRVITRHVADRDGDVVAQWLTRPAILAEMAHLGIQRVLRMASDVSDDEPAIASAFADSPEDIRSRIRERRREQQAAWERFDLDQRESAARVTGIDHEALGTAPGTEVLVDYLLPSGSSLAVPISGDGFGWAVPLGVAEVQAGLRLTADEAEPSTFIPVGDVVTSVIDELALDWAELGADALKCAIDDGVAWINSANTIARELDVDVDFQPVNQTVLLAPVTENNLIIALADDTPMAMAQRIGSVAGTGRSPPTQRWAGYRHSLRDHLAGCRCNQVVARVAIDLAPNLRYNYPNKRAAVRAGPSEIN